MRSSYITGYHAPTEYVQAMMKIADEVDCAGAKKPENFKRIMYTNRGTITRLSSFPAPEDGLEPKNPLIVGFGDSVTAGRFEQVFSNDEEFREHLERLMQGKLKEGESGEVFDLMNCYLTKFWQQVVDFYQNTTVSVINSGIAGDSVLGMEKRMDRDVLRYQPDLVIINAVLNWDPSMGACEIFKTSMSNIVKRIKNETKADIILMTPNMSLAPRPDMENTICTLDERVEAVREIAAAEDTCLADAYMVWKEYEKQGYPVKPMLANGFNHPSVEGHELFAKILMKVVK